MSRGERLIKLGDSLFSTKHMLVWYIQRSNGKVTDKRIGNGEYDEGEFVWSQSLG